MGCGASKPPRAHDVNPAVQGGVAAPHSPTRDALGRRVSVEYVAKEMQLEATTATGAPFDRDRVGTHTRHGISPGPSGGSKAKINQVRRLARASPGEACPCARPAPPWA